MFYGKARTGTTQSKKKPRNSWKGGGGGEEIMEFLKQIRNMVSDFDKIIQVILHVDIFTEFM
jgi:hypothetical protein